MAVPGSRGVRPRRGRGARALTAYLRAAADPRLRAGLRRARLGCAGLRARPPRASAAPARSLGSARLGSARRCPGRSLAAHAARGGRGAGWRAAAWKLLIWAVMSGEVAEAGPPTSFHLLPRVSCRRARGPRHPPAWGASLPAWPRRRPLWGRHAPGSRWAGARRTGGSRRRVCVWGIPGSLRPRGGSARRPPR